MTTRISVGVIPAIGRPSDVSARLDEASQLRARHREANETLAAAQQALEQAQQADVAATAERIRQGAAPGALPTAIAKARDRVEMATRNAAAIGLATDAADDDLGEAITRCADVWRSELDDETERAREQGRAAIASLREALVHLSDAVSAQNWIVGAISDQRFDRPQRAVIVGSAAPSSSRRTVNSEPLTRDELLGYVDELLLEPTTAGPMPVALVESA